MSLKIQLSRGTLASRTPGGAVGPSSPPDGELRASVDRPDRMVQMQDVDPRDRSIGVDQLGVEAGDVAGLLGPELLPVAVDRRPEFDGVLARSHRDRPVAVGDVLDALVVDVGRGVGLVGDRRASGVSRDPVSDDTSSRGRHGQQQGDDRASERGQPMTYPDDESRLPCS